MELLEALIATIEHLLASRYTSAAGLIALLYDHILTFDDEFQFIWKAEWRIPKVLFLINRYMVPTGMLVAAYVMSGLTIPDLSDKFCKGYFSLLILMGMLSIAISNFLVLLRLWIIWDRNAGFIAWTLFAFVANQCAAVTTIVLVFIQLYDVAYFDPLIHTCYLRKKIDLSDLWIPGIIFEVMIFITTFWNAFHRPRNADTAITNQLYRDGFSYFITLFLLRIVNLTLALASPVSMSFLAVFFIWAISNITITRLILNCCRLTAASAHPDQALDSMELPQLNLDDGLRMKPSAHPTALSTL